MDKLRPIEFKLIDELFGMSSGWVLDFSNQTFDEFFRAEVGINIYDDAYALGSGSKGKRLRQFLLVGQPRAVARALAALWEYREVTRLGSSTPETVFAARDRLSAVVERLGGGPLPSFDKPAETPAPSGPSPKREDSALLRLEEEFLSLYQMSDAPQARGYSFEKLLTALFNAWNMDARGGFRVEGEQIDGSFHHGEVPYLLEAKWQRSKADADKLRSFQGKVLDRPDWTRGFFVSFEGFTEGALQAFQAKRIILADGMDIFDAIKRRISLPDIITAKMRHASEYRNSFQRVRDLFPSK